MYMPGQPPFNNVTGSAQQGMYQPAIYPDAPYDNQWTPYGWVPLMAPQPIPPPPGFFPYGYPWQQQMQPNFINMGLQYQINNGSSQFGNPSYNQQIAQQQQDEPQPPQQNESSQIGNSLHQAQTKSEQLPQQTLQHQKPTPLNPELPQTHSSQKHQPSEKQSPQKQTLPQNTPMKRQSHSSSENKNYLCSWAMLRMKKMI
jgi:hypothetical protein